MAVSAEMIKQTQSSLGQFVKKPPLTEKLLNKPPFRFLHDVITAVITDTGALNGLFDDLEMSSENVKDKDAKVEYLTKLIDALSFSSGQTLTVKPGKIVSGQEADKTNEMLQVLANIVINKIDTSDAVKKVKNGEKPGKGKKSGSKKDEKKPRESSKSPVKTPSKKETTPSKKDRDNKENKENSNRNRSPSKSSRSKEPMTSPKKMVNGNHNDVDNDLITNGLVAPSDTEPLTNGHASKEDIEPVVGNQDNAQLSPREPEPAPSRPKTATRPTTSKDRRKHQKSPSPVNGILSKQNSVEEPQVLGSNPSEEQDITSSGRPTTASVGMRAGSARPRTGRARPPSARPAAPAIKKKREVAVEEQPRPATAKVSNVILDNDDDNDDGEEFLIEEAPKDPLVSLDPGEDTAVVNSGGEEHGILVQQMLEAQKLQDGNKRDKKAVEIEREAGVGDSTRARDRESTLREVDKLRSSIQTLTKSAHPLGKLMDFLQEDVDSMQRELDQWKTENHSLQLQLKKEESITAQTLQPLVATLEELTAAVNDNLDKISLVKSNILKNEDKIEKMISSMGLAHK